jgi:hypothetical protein
MKKKNINEAVPMKMIRDYDKHVYNPFLTNENYLTKDNTFSVSASNKDEARNVTGVHKISKDQAIELMSGIIKDKLDITRGGINIFRYLFSKLELFEGEYSMTVKIDFNDCKNDIGYDSTQSVWNGLAELLDKDIIARSSVPGVYFLNSNFFLLTETIVVTEYYKLSVD